MYNPPIIVQDVENFFFGARTWNEPVWYQNLMSGKDYHIPIFSNFLLMDHMYKNPIHLNALQVRTDLIIDDLYPKIEKSRCNLSYSQVGNAVKDFIVFGNAYFLFSEQKLSHLPAPYVLLKKDLSRFTVFNNNDSKDFEAGDILHIQQYTPASLVYGLPNYLPALLHLKLYLSILQYKMNFYKNGTHGRIVLSKIPTNTSVGSAKDSELTKRLREVIENPYKNGSNTNAYINIPSTPNPGSIGGGGDKLSELVEIIELSKNLKNDDCIAMLEICYKGLNHAFGMHASYLGIEIEGKTNPNFERLDTFVNKIKIKPVTNLFFHALKEHFKLKKNNGFLPKKWL